MDLPGLDNYISLKDMLIHFGGDKRYSIKHLKERSVIFCCSSHDIKQFLETMGHESDSSFDETMIYTQMKFLLNKLLKVVNHLSKFKIRPIFIFEQRCFADDIIILNFLKAFGIPGFISENPAAASGNLLTKRGIHATITSDLNNVKYGGRFYITKNIFDVVRSEYWEVFSTIVKNKLKKHKSKKNAFFELFLLLTKKGRFYTPMLSKSNFLETLSRSEAEREEAAQELHATIEYEKEQSRPKNNISWKIPDLTKITKVLQHQNFSEEEIQIKVTKMLRRIKANQEFICSICNKKLLTKKSILDHIVRKHPKE